MKASDALIKSLEREGVKYVFGVPGEENLDVLESIRQSSLQFILTRHEQAAGFMAATIGRLTGEPGVCLSTLGPGATNLMTAAAYAQLGAMPILMITGQKPIKKSKQGHFQILNTVDMMRPVTKMTKQIIAGTSVSSAIREACRLAREERPGAVHLELPEDVAAEEVDFVKYPIHRSRRPVAEHKAVAQAVDMIKSAKHPLLLIGAGANRKLTSNMLREFVDKTGIPFFSTQLGKGVIDERHPRCLGTAALSSNDYVHCAVEQADLIINVGHDVIEKPPFVMDPHGKLQVIHVNFYAAKVDEVYFPQLDVVGDIANAIWQIKETLEVQPTWDFSYFLKVKQQLDEHVGRDMRSDAFPVIPQRLVADVRSVMPEDGLVCLDNGMYKLWFTRNYPAYERNTLLVDNALATMGAGLPSAMAARLVFPERKILAVCGDGGFMMNSQELETAVRLHMNLVVLILNDQGFGMIQWKQQASGLVNFGLDFGNPDFVKYAESYGATGIRVSQISDLVPIIQAALNTSGVQVIEVAIDYAENVKVLTQELQQKTCVLN